jgi:general secretion pathway protein L
MSVLVLTLLPRERLASREAAADGGGSALHPPSDWTFVFSDDGRNVAQQGQAALALLPRADSLVLVLAEADVSWHRIELPRAPPQRLRAALLGVMEESLLEDDEQLHFALAEGALPGQTGWVAVTHRPRLAAALAAIEAGGLSVERVVAALAPQGRPHGHFFSVDDGEEAAPWLALAQADSAACLRLNGGLARALLPAADAGTRWTATPAAAVAAERWLGAPVAVLTDAERALEAAQGTTNLRQFDLSARHRGTRALRDLGKRLLSAEWRPVRAGLAVLVGVQLLGLNLSAWQLSQAVAAKRVAMGELLKKAHPGVRAVLDAPLQMQRETERLRTAAGRPGETDLEGLLGAAAAAWPDGQGPVQMLRFESGRLSVLAPGFGEPQLVQFRDRLRASGLNAEMADGRIQISRPAAERSGA